jgi:hypothetical protein
VPGALVELEADRPALGEPQRAGDYPLRARVPELGPQLANEPTEPLGLVVFRRHARIARQRPRLAKHRAHRLDHLFRSEPELLHRRPESLLQHRVPLDIVREEPHLASATSGGERPDLVRAFRGGDRDLEHGVPAVGRPDPDHIGRGAPANGAPSTVTDHRRCSSVMIPGRSRSHRAPCSLRWATRCRTSTGNSIAMSPSLSTRGLRREPRERPGGRANVRERASVQWTAIASLAQL